MLQVVGTIDECEVEGSHAPEVIMKRIRRDEEDLVCLAKMDGLPAKGSPGWIFRPLRQRSLHAETCNRTD